MRRRRTKTIERERNEKYFYYHKFIVTDEGEEEACVDETRYIN